MVSDSGRSGGVIRTSNKTSALAGTARHWHGSWYVASGNSRISSSNVANSTVTPANDANMRGLVRSYTYDNNSNVVKTTEYDGTLASPDYRDTHIAYDAMNRPGTSDHARPRQ